MMRRFIFSLAAALLLFARSMLPSFAAQEPAPMRVVQVDLDYVYDEDPAQEQKNLDELVARIAAMKITAVFLQAFADPEGSGIAEKTYFPNSKLKMRADLFGKAVKALKERAHVKVFGWLPVLSFDFGDDAQEVLAWKPTTGRTDPDSGAYRRLSPFDLKARTDIIDLYEDMARAAPIDGILFHDDALLSDYEDGSPAALDFYAHAGFPASVRDIRSSAKTMQRWTAFKTAALVEFTEELANHVRAIRGPIETVRDIYAPVVLNPKSEQWFAQNYPLFLKSYDYTAIEAMPEMEDVPDDQADVWLHRLVDAAESQPDGLEKTIFELQAVDWHKQDQGDARAIPTATLAAEMRLLEEAGAMNYGYYPDDFVTDTPKAVALYQDFSLPTTVARP